MIAYLGIGFVLRTAHSHGAFRTVMGVPQIYGKSIDLFSFCIVLIENTHGDDWGTILGNRLNRIG